MTGRLRLVLTVPGPAASQSISDYQPGDTTMAVDRSYVSLYRFALCLTASHSKATALVRQTLLNLRRWRHQTQDYSTIERRLFTTLHRSYLKIRSPRDRLQAEPVRETRDPTAPEPECLGLAGACDLPAALAQVNEACRATLSLFYLGNFSVRDIAYILELPIDSVMSKLSKGREQLRSILKAPAETVESRKSRK